MFIYLKDIDKYVHINYDSDTIVNKLESKIYDVEKLSQMGLYTFKENRAFVNGRIAKAGIFKQVKDYMDVYFSENGKKVREAMKLPSRLGMFFKGEPGTGKTFLAAKIAYDLIERENAIGIYTTELDLNFTDIIDAIRTKDPDRLIIFILDEFEKDYTGLNSSERDSLLAFLDGGKSRDNVVVIATANSLNGIPATLLQRPGRFEKVIEFHIKNDEILENLVDCLIPDTLKEGINQREIINYAKFDNELTIDRLKSIVRDSLVHYLNTGKLFPDKTDILESIDKKVLEKEMKPKTRRNNNRGLSRFFRYMNKS